MNKLDYLSSIRTDNPREIFDTWNAFGELKVNNKTKFFAKDTIFQVTEDGPLKNAIIYCKYAYSVEPDNGFEAIDWKNAQKDDIEGKVYFYQGVVSPNFQVLLTPEEYDRIDKTIETPEDFIPFTNNNAKTSSISISDQELSFPHPCISAPYGQRTRGRTRA